MCAPEVPSARGRADAAFAALGVQALATELLDGHLDVSSFLASYKKERHLYHLRSAKVEKLAALLANR